MTFQYIKVYIKLYICNINNSIFINNYFIKEINNFKKKKKKKITEKKKKKKKKFKNGNFK